MARTERRIYLDHAASTPVDPRVFRVMRPYFADKFGNPGSLHGYGQEAMAAVDRARETVAKLLGAEFRQIFFTGSATEANNLALRGAVAGANIAKPKIMVSAVEHESVLETARALGRAGAEVVILPVDRAGRVHPSDIRKHLDLRTVLVSVMYVNNETGTVENAAECAKIVQSFRTERGSAYPLYHSDAVQAFRFLECRPKELGADLLTLSAHKLGGPKGVGILYAREPERLTAVMTGGGQEHGLRSGTENVALIAGAAEALQLAERERKTESDRERALAEGFLRDLRGAMKELKLNGVEIGRDDRISGILSLRFPGRRAEEILTALDLRGVAVSAGSACASRAAEPSHVLRAMGLTEREARESLRVSFGRETTASDLRTVAKAIREILKSKQ